MEEELRKFGVGVVAVASIDTTSVFKDPSSVFILQRYSNKWNTFINVERIGEICDGDRVTVVPLPKPKVGSD